MEIFNKYGVLTHPETQKLDDELSRMARTHMEQLIEAGATPEQIRAVAHYFACSIDSACCEVVLRTGIKIRKNERGED